MERWEAIIVGAGPAGTATALGLAARDPGLARGTLLLDKAVHPRDKTCAGGVIPKALAVLAELGVPFDVPHARVDAATVHVPDGRRLDVPGDDLCRVVRRREFDARLAWAARDRGVVLREGARVTAVVRDGDGVRVDTAAGSHWARVVVGADGSGSQVRRALVDAGDGLVGRAVMADVPVAATRWDGDGRRRYDFDFRCVAQGVRGYRWVFPCVIDGVPHANVGVYALPPVDGRTLQAELRALCDEIGAAPATWKAFPIRTWTGGPIAAPGVVLAGDAAGCDPLMGEGISYALEYGTLAAEAIVRARTTGDWTFTGYQRAVARGPLGRKLRLLRFAVRCFYGRAWPLAFRVAAASPRAQAIGLAWYNGVGGWDAKGPLAMLGALATRRGPAPGRSALADA